MNSTHRLFQKRIFWLIALLAIATMFGLAACGGSTATAQSNTTAATSVATPTTAPTPTVAATPTTAPTPTPKPKPTVAPAPKPTIAPMPAAPVATVVQVKIVEINNKYSFQPAAITVTKGTKIVWLNTSDAPHTVTSDTNAFTTSSNLTQNQTFSMVMTTSGSYAYHCAIHPYMQATIVVTS